MLTIIVPCHNEELSISRTINQIKASFPVEIVENLLVVDNASNDLTRSIAEDLGATTLPEPKLGKGYAFRRGIMGIGEKSRAIFMVDGDDTYDTSAMKLAYSKIIEEGYDMVIGVRREQASDSYRLGHKFGNWFLTRFHKVMFGADVRDSLSGWRMMSRGFVLSYPAGATGFELETALNAHASNINASVTFVEVDYKGRLAGSKSKLRTFRDGIRIIARSLDLWRSEKPFKAYVVLALPWFILCLSLFYRVLQDYIVTGLVPKVPSLIVAVGSYVIATHLWIAGIILQRSVKTRTELARYIYLQESRK